MTRFWYKQNGQGTVEAALLIPVVCIGLLLLIQPAIVLYDRMVMTNAANETCRVLMTLSAEETQYKGESYALRRLGAIPQQQNFHVHEGGCSYSVECVGSQASNHVEVKIQNRLKPLPLIGAGAEFLGLLDADGCLVVEANAQMSVQPEWVAESGAGGDPSSWAGAWLS